MIWTGSKIKDLEFDVRQELGNSMCCESATKIADNIVLDVMTDLKETADEEYNSADIRIAIGRVLEKRLGIKD